MVLKLGHTREMVELLVYNEQGYLITDHNLIETAADEARGVHLSSHPAKLTLQLQIKASPPPMGLGACVFGFSSLELPPRETDSPASNQSKPPANGSPCACVFGFVCFNSDTAKSPCVCFLFL
jgi:hypothetical protein